MSGPAASTISRDHWPPLDGIRAFAIIAVVAYHLGYLPGGWIGVDVFFVLSGYLITAILLGEGGPSRGLGRFWGRRARRLLPAVLLLLLVLSLFAWAGALVLIPAQLRAPALTTLFYSANWQQVLAGHSYFAHFSAPAPLQHTWSLAIEEQYYLVWPLLLSGLLLVTGRAQEHRRRVSLLSATLFLAAASAIWMGVAAHLFGANRAYLGTDTRAWELLVGGAAAMAWPPGGRFGRGRAWSVAALAGAAGVVVGAFVAGGPPAWIWDGGLVAIGVCAGAVIVGGIRGPAGPLGRLLGGGLLRWFGLISYSLYLWHWPVIVLMTGDTTGLSGVSLLVARLTTMLALSCGSYYLVERPLRRFDWRGLAARLRFPVPGLAAAGAAALAVLIMAGTVGPPVATSAAVSLAGLPTSVPDQAPLGLDLPPASPAHPYRAWILGDSVMFDSSLGLQAALQATGEVSVVMNSSFPGWGLTTDRSWPADAERVMDRYHPQIVIGTWSWDDPLAATHPEAYLQRLEAAIRMLLAPGRGVRAVVLLQFPQTGPSFALTDPQSREAAWRRQTHQQLAWDALGRRAAADFPGRALYLTTDALFAPGGRFSAWFRAPSGRWIRARKLDNMHMCPYGAAALGALVTRDLASPLGLAPMRPGWSTGSWTRSPRYDQPAGACPADGPPSGYHGVVVPGGAA